MSAAIAALDSLIADLKTLSVVTNMSSTQSSRVKFGVATSVDEKIHLITRNLEEVMGAEKAIEKLRSILEERDLQVYWGTATTGQPHIAYFVPMSKLADFLRAGCHVTILFADLHAFLDNLKSTWDVLKYRTEFYEVIIKSMLESIGVPLDKLKFVRGTDYQLSKEYTLDVYKLTSLCTDKRAIKAGAEVVKQSENALLSGLLYPLLQALDEEYLKVDAQFGGTDQRKIFTLCEEFLPKIGYSKRLHLMNPMVAGLQGAKMSSSDKSSKIGLLDPPDVLKKKIGQAFCEEGNIENNGVLSFVKMVLLPLSETGTFTIERPEKFGGNVTFNTYDELETAFASKQVHPGDLKNAVTKVIDGLLSPIRAKFDKDPKLRELLYNAYPEERPAPQEEKKAAAPAKKKGGKDEVDITKLDLRVGKIVKIGKHESADTLYVEDIDIGEGAPRQVVSGLAKYYTLEQMQDRLVVVLCNMKPSKLRGVESKAMVLAASSADGNTVELIDPPAGSKPGERLKFEGYEINSDLKVEIPRANENVLKTVTGAFKTNASRVATWNNIPFTTSVGPVTVPTLIDAPIK